MHTKVSEIWIYILCVNCVLHSKCITLGCLLVAMKFVLSEMLQHGRWKFKKKLGFDRQQNRKFASHDNYVFKAKQKQKNDG